MSTYDGNSSPNLINHPTNHQPVEHNTDDPSVHTAPRRRRPDLSTFFATLSEISPDESRTRPHAVPVPRDVSAAFYSLADALEVMRREGGGGGATESGQGLGQAEAGPEGEGSDVLSQMIQTLLREADTPPTEVEGVSEEFCDGTSSTQGFINNGSCHDPGGC